MKIELKSSAKEGLYKLIFVGEDETTFVFINKGDLEELQRLVNLTLPLQKKDVNYLPLPLSNDVVLGGSDDKESTPPAANLPKDETISKQSNIAEVKEGLGHAVTMFSCENNTFDNFLSDGSPFTQFVDTGLESLSEEVLEDVAAIFKIAKKFSNL